MRAKERPEITRTKEALRHNNLVLKIRGPSQQLIDARTRLQQQLYKLQHPECTPIHEERQAKACADRSDKSTRAMFSPYKSVAKQQFINEIAKPEGGWKEGQTPNFTSHTKQPKEVPAALRDYYSMLLSEKQIDQNEKNRILNELKKTPISAGARNKLEQDITKDEVADVMEHLPLGKQAGPDRIPNAVFRNLSKFLAPKLTAVLHEALQKDRLPASFIQGDISLLYKKGQRDDPRNYRPITLLQTAYKIYTRVLTRRMRDVVHQFVTNAQKGFVPKAFIAECTMLLNLVEDLLQLAVATGMPTPQDVPTFLLTGWLGKDAKGNERVISNDHAGIFFLGWRCLYAEIVRSRVDAVRIDLEKALKRAVAMIIGRIKAALSFWKSRVQTTRYQRRPFEINEKRRDRKIAYQEADGEYRLHQDLLSLATDLGLDPTKG